MSSVYWDLTSLLPRGTITFEEGPWRSTIDLVLASRGLGGRATRCRIYPVEHGSDHRAIETTFLSDKRPTFSGPPRPLFREAPWADINRELKDLETEVLDITSRSELKSTVERLTNRVSQTVRLLVPIAQSGSLHIAEIEYTDSGSSYMCLVARLTQASTISCYMKTDVRSEPIAEQFICSDPD
jgi:hypothetical protein